MDSAVDGLDLLFFLENTEEPISTPCVDLTEDPNKGASSSSPSSSLSPSPGNPRELNRRESPDGPGVVDMLEGPAGTRNLLPEKAGVDEYCVLDRRGLIDCCSR